MSDRERRAALCHVAEADAARSRLLTLALIASLAINTAILAGAAVIATNDDAGGWLTDHIGAARQSDVDHVRSAAKRALTTATETSEAVGDPYLEGLADNTCVKGAGLGNRRSRVLSDRIFTIEGCIVSHERRLADLDATPALPGLADSAASTALRVDEVERTLTDHEQRLDAACFWARQQATAFSGTDLFFAFSAFGNAVCTPRMAARCASSPRPLSPCSVVLTRT